MVCVCVLTHGVCVCVLCRRLDQDDFKRVVKQGLVVLSEVGGLVGGLVCLCCSKHSSSSIITDQHVCRIAVLWIHNNSSMHAM